MEGHNEISHHHLMRAGKTGAGALTRRIFCLGTTLGNNRLVHFCVRDEFKPLLYTYDQIAGTLVYSVLPAKEQFLVCESIWTVV